MSGLQLLRLLWCGVALILCASHSARAGVSPLVAGPGPGDSVWVTISVNDTLGNAADADTLVIHWLHEGALLDSTVIASAGWRTGQYILPHAASDGGALGDYQFLVRAHVGDRRPITNYPYTVAGDPCLGEGPAACTLFTLRDLGADTVAVSGVSLRVFNSSQNATLALARTDVQGRVLLSLPVDTTHVIGTLMGYTIAPATVIVGSSGVTDTLWATAFDPGAPASPGLCRVYGWVQDLRGDTIANASVHARIVESPLRAGNVIIAPYALTTTTDSTGYWSFDLIPSSVLSPDTTRYEFTIRYPSGAILRRRLAVPDTSEWLLTW